MLHKFSIFWFSPWSRACGPMLGWTYSTSRGRLRLQTSPFSEEGIHTLVAWFDHMYTFSFLVSVDCSLVTFWRGFPQTIQDVWIVPAACCIRPWPSTCEGLQGHQSRCYPWKSNVLCFELQDLLLPLLPAIIDVWNLPACVTSGQPQEEVSFEAIQLSCQGAERQRKNAPCSTPQSFFCCAVFL